MCKLLWHSFLWPASRGLSSSSSSRVFIEFPHCFLGRFGQFCLSFFPFLRKVLTTLDAGGISNLAWCQWRSWARRVESKFLHVLWSDIPVLPPFPCPSPLYPLDA